MEGWFTNATYSNICTHTHNLFSHSLKAPRSVAQFISPSHLYTLAYRTVALLLHNTIQNSWQQPHLSYWLITLNMWLWPPQNVFPIYSFISSRFNRSTWLWIALRFWFPSFDSQIVTPPLLFPVLKLFLLFSRPLTFYPHILPLVSHSILSVMMMTVMTAMRPAVLWSHSHIKWKPNLASPL